MSERSPMPGSSNEGCDPLPAVDAAIERLLASTPLRRPSAALDARIHALLEERPQAWRRRMAPIAAAAGFALAVGFVAGNWSSQIRLNGGSLGLGGGSLADTARPAASRDLNLVHQESSARPAAFAGTRTVDLGDDGTVQTAPSLWIRTDRFRDPARGVTIERSYPEAWMVVGRPSTD